MKAIAALSFVALMTSAAVGQQARAAVTETFSFSNLTGWGTGTLSPLTGQFTGTVEPSGFIELADLTKISINAKSLTTPALSNAGLGDLTFFSYDTTGGASSLAFIASQGGGRACAGAPSVLSLACNPGGLLPPETKAVMLLNGEFLDFTSNLTTVTLVPTPAPEPPAWAMLLLGFAGLGLASRTRAMFKAVSPPSR